MNNAFRKTIRGIDAVVNFAAVVFLVLLLLVGLYALWDTRLVHTEASSSTLRPYKPTQGNKYSFDELRSNNPDVKGWVQLYGTGIDYPVLYSDVVNYYVYRDVWKNSSLIGSIFIDNGCNPNFKDFNTILYGHHMESHCMFGDITQFDQEGFFDKHKYGDLYVGDDDRHYGLKVLGYLLTRTNDPFAYKVKVPRSDAIPYYNGLMSEAVNWRDNEFDFSNNEIVVMSTCTDSSDTARSVLIAAKTDETYENPFQDEINLGPGVDDLKGWLGFPWIAWFAGLVVIVMITIYTLWQVNNVKEKRKIERMVRNNDKFKNEKNI